MNTIKRLPTLEECHEKSYRALYYKIKALPDKTIQLVPPQVMLNPEVVNYPIFEFTLEEAKDAYLAELETKLEEVFKEVNFRPTSCFTSQEFAIGAINAQKILKNYF